MPAPNIRATTQEHLSIEDITHNLIILKDGSAAMVLKIRAINFNLLSEQEQDSIIYSYAGLLNSLSFPIQILIRSQKKDISNYLRLIKTYESKQLNPVIKSRITAYREFIERIVKERNVLDKTFFTIIPFTPSELGISQSKNPVAKKPQRLPYDKNYIIQKALNSLEPKRDHLLRQFAHLNLSPKQLATQELIQLFYNIYNPDSHEGVTLANPTQYQQSLVQSSSQIAPKTQSPTNNQPTSVNPGQVNTPSNPIQTHPQPITPLPTTINQQPAVSTTTPNPTSNPTPQPNSNQPIEPHFNPPANPNPPTPPITLPNQ